MLDGRQRGVHGGSIEGKEQRFGIACSALFAVVTTGASCGAVNAMQTLHSARRTVPLFNMMTGEVIFGGVGGALRHDLFVVLACSSPA